MKGEGMRIERETIINFNEDEENASVWTASEVVYRRLLKRLGKDYLTEDGERHAEFKFPKGFLNLPRAKAKRVLSPTQTLAIKNRLAGRPKIKGQKGQSGVSAKPGKDR